MEDEIKYYSIKEGIKICDYTKRKVEYLRQERNKTPAWQVPDQGISFYFPSFAHFFFIFLFSCFNVFFIL